MTHTKTAQPGLLPLLVAAQIHTGVSSCKSRAYMNVQSSILCRCEQVRLIKGGGHRCDCSSLAVMHLLLPEWCLQQICIAT